MDNRSKVGRFDDSDLTARPGMIPRTNDAGVVEKKLEAVTDLQQHYETEKNRPWSITHKTVDGVGNTILYGLSKDKGKQLELGNQCLVRKLGFVTKVRSPSKAMILLYIA